MRASGFPEVGPADLERAFGEVGLTAGQVVYAGSSLAGLAYVERPEELVTGALDRVLGASGTLVMPSGGKSFRRDGIFDREHTPSGLGMLTEYFRRLPGTRRSFAPPFNPVCARGPLADELCAIESETSFGPDSVYEYMTRFDTQLLIIGCNFHDGISHMHCLEERHGAPFRRWKPHRGKLIVDGVPTEREFRHHTRIPTLEVSYAPLEDVLRQAGAMRYAQVGLCRIGAVSLKDFFDVLDPWYVRNRELLVTRRADGERA
ncbi:AAC(3) family N-acetyltransferase [Streptomyces sp. NPDC046727]|uniref:AAC(3) family N-acetyltransferase n=1 Tax=Streptomyces sp. NPDC046727 TaxID=3155373 RepID=UPI0033E91BC4